jgi:hypothetical protein
MEVFFSTVNDSLYTQKFFQVNCFLYWQDISKTQRPAVTDTTLSLALKQFDAQNDKTIYLRYPMSVFRIDSKIFKKMAVRVKRFECLEVSSEKCIF